MPSHELVIRIQLPRWTRLRWAGLVLSMVLLAGGVVYANVMWTPFTQGEKLSSAKMNANFTAIATAINALQNTPPGSTLQPHLVLNAGNVDLGIYLGFYVTPGGNSQFPLVFSPRLKAPLAFPPANTIVYFAGPNCTGAPAAAGPIQFTNQAFNTLAGTIYQQTGPIQPFTAVSYYDGGGCGTFANPLAGFNYPVQDTKVPNITFKDLTTTSIQLM